MSNQTKVDISASSTQLEEMSDSPRQFQCLNAAKHDRRDVRQTIHVVPWDQAILACVKRDSLSFRPA